MPTLRVENTYSEVSEVCRTFNLIIENGWPADRDSVKLAR